MICLFGYYRCVTLRHALCHATHHVTRLHLSHALSVTAYITWFPVTLLFFYPQILCCHAPLLSVSCDFPHVTFLVMYLYSRYALVLTRLHLGHALYVTFSISDFSSLRWSPTHKILSLSRPIQRHGPLRITSLLCHALVITWRHYTLASLSFPSLTIYVSLHCHALVITWRHYALAPLSFFVTHRLCCHALLITWRYCNPTSFYFALSLPY